MANQPIRALVEAVFALQRVEDERGSPADVSWEYTAPHHPKRTVPFSGSIRFHVEPWCLLHDMKKFDTFISGLALMLHSDIYDGILDNEYDDEMHGVVLAYRECCMAHHRRELEA